MLPLMRMKLHYDWHWQWPTGAGEIANNGVHQLDQVRWALAKSNLPRTVISIGGLFGFTDDGQTPNAFEAGKYELLRFASHYAPGRLEISVTPETGRTYAPAAHVLTLKVHNVAARPRAVEAAGHKLPFRWDAAHKLLEVTLPALQGKPVQLALSL